jgi:hypothetical protein
VDHERDLVEALLRAEALERLDVALPGARRVGLRVAEAGEVGGERVEAGGGQRLEHRLPHVRRLRIAVDQHHSGVSGGSRLAVV